MEGKRSRRKWLILQYKVYIYYMKFKYHNGLPYSLFIIIQHSTFRALLGLYRPLIYAATCEGEKLCWTFIGAGCYYLERVRWRLWE
jgi:hypothetical protein